MTPIEKAAKASYEHFYGKNVWEKTTLTIKNLWIGSMRAALESLMDWEPSGGEYIGDLAIKGIWQSCIKELLEQTDDEA